MRAMACRSNEYGRTARRWPRNTGGYTASHAITGGEQVKHSGTMRAIEALAFSIDALKLAERPVPAPRRGEILVRIRAVSL